MGLLARPLFWLIGAAAAYFAFKKDGGGVDVGTGLGPFVAVTGSGSGAFPDASALTAEVLTMSADPGSDPTRRSWEERAVSA